MRNKAYLLLILLSVLGVLLRLILINTGISLDEAITLYVARSDSFQEFIERTMHYEFGPPLYFTIMQSWIRLFGVSAQSLSIPSIIFGVILIPFTFDLANELTGDKTVAKLSAYFATISPLAIFFSHEVRTYSLLTLLTTMTIWSFYKTQREQSHIYKIILFISTTLLFYTHYVGVIFVLLLFLSYLYSSLFRKKKNFKAIGVSALIFSGAALTMIPYLPVLSQHLLHGTYWVDKTPISEWPFVFTSNLAACMPLPWLYGFISIIIMVPVLAVWTIIYLKKNESRSSIKDFLASNYFVLISILVYAASTLGFLTPFIMGYCRYMTPFAVLEWILLAGFCNHFLSGANKITKCVIATVLVLAGLSSAQEIYSIAQTDRNGLRAVAKDIKNNAYNDCAFLLLPDFNSYTLMYFLKTEQKIALPEIYLTYPRKNERKPTKHLGYAKLWQDPEIVNKLFSEIAAIDTSKAKNLAVILDKSVLNSKLMPAKKRLNSIVSRLKEEYKMIDKKEYDTKGKSFTVYKFQL